MDEAFDHDDDDDDDERGTLGVAMVTEVQDHRTACDEGQEPLSSSTSSSVGGMPIIGVEVVGEGVIVGKNHGSDVSSSSSTLTSSSSSSSFLSSSSPTSSSQYFVEFDDGAREAYSLSGLLELISAYGLPQMPQSSSSSSAKDTNRLHRGKRPKFV